MAICPPEFLLSAIIGLFSSLVQMSDFAVDAIPEFLSMIGARELFCWNWRIQKSTERLPSLLDLKYK